MMRSVLPQTQAVPSDPAALMQILQDQQVAYTVQLSDATRKLNEAAKQYERAEGAQKEAVSAQLTEFESRVAITQQRLSNVNERIAQVQRDAAISTMGNRAPTGVAVADDQSRVLGVRRNDFEGGLMILIVFPIVVAITRWIWRRSPTRGPNKVLEDTPQFTRLEQAVEAIAIEVERIGEAQRFSAKLLAERPVEARAEPPSQPARARRPVITPVP
jgi:hypothetical protein